jgi:hypothetical protein
VLNFVTRVGESSNGRTPDSGSGSWGSNPCSPARSPAAKRPKLLRHPCGCLNFSHSGSRPYLSGAVQILAAHVQTHCAVEAVSRYASSATTPGHCSPESCIHSSEPTLACLRSPYRSTAARDDVDRAALCEARHTWLGSLSAWNLLGSVVVRDRIAGGLDRDRSAVGAPRWV